MGVLALDHHGACAFSRVILDGAASGIFRVQRCPKVIIHMLPVHAFHTVNTETPIGARHVMSANARALQEQACSWHVVLGWGAHARYPGTTSTTQSCLHTIVIEIQPTSLNQFLRGCRCEALCHGVELLWLPEGTDDVVAHCC